MKRLLVISGWYYLYNWLLSGRSLFGRFKTEWMYRYNVITDITIIADHRRPLPTKITCVHHPVRPKAIASEPIAIAMDWTSTKMYTNKSSALKGFIFLLKEHSRPHITTVWLQIWVLEPSKPMRSARLIWKIYCTTVSQPWMITNRAPPSVFSSAGQSFRSLLH